MRSKAQCVVVLVALISVCSSAEGQLVMGRVRDNQSGAPLRQLSVALVADTSAVTVVLTRSTTDTGGVFYLVAPKAGIYRVAFMLPKSTMLSDLLTVSSGDVQREFVLDVQGAEQPYFEFQVEKLARPLPDQPGPRYPEGLRNEGVEGEVLVQFVVDTLGHAEMSTFKVWKSTHPDFTDAVRVALPQIAFAPAEVHGRKVRQLVQMPFGFCLRNGSPSACSP